MKEESRQFPARWQLLVSEPFRLFFALGLLTSIAGTALWPLFYAGALPYHPALVHARLMIEGFAGALILGFLGTAVPRMLDAPSLRTWELVVFVALLLASMLAHACQRLALGDALFAALLGLFLFLLLLRRLRARDEKLPIGFVIALSGVLCGILGALLSAAVFHGHVTSFFGYRLGTLLLFQGFVLLPLLGAGSFLFPRFLPDPDGAGRTSSRLSTSVLAVLTVLLIVASFVIEALQMSRSASWLRFVAAAGFLFLATPAFRRTRTPGTLAFSLRVGILCLLGGLAAGAVWPQYRIGMTHIFFVGGLGVLALTVATRVVLGHSGSESQFFAKLRPLRWILVLIFVGMATRVSADPLPRIMISHHIYAAVLWIGAVIVWLAWMLPKLVRCDEASEDSDA